MPNYAGDLDTTIIKPLAANTPGGIGPHFRVQYLSADGKLWLKHSIYRTAATAEACASELLERGVRARVVKYEGCAC